jgi:hypothetical protein
MRCAVIPLWSLRELFTSGSYDVQCIDYDDWEEEDDEDDNVSHMLTTIPTLVE